MKTAIVTGASGGIGSAIAEKLVHDGYFVAALYNNNIEGINNLTNKLAKENLKDYVFAVQCDLAKPQEIEKAFLQIKKSFSHVDVLVNNAGVALYKLATETTEDEWDKVFSVNTRAAAILTKLVLEGMIEQKSGKIVNVSSVWGNVGASMEVAYSASKAAIIGYTKALAKEVALSGINVNCICPGVIETAMNNRLSQSELKEVIETIPLMRMGKAQEVAELVSFLSGNKSDYITGQVITIDGGFTL